MLEAGVEYGCVEEGESEVAASLGGDPVWIDVSTRGKVVNGANDVVDTHA